MMCILLVGSGFLGSLVRAQCPNTIPGVTNYGTGSYSVKKIGDSCLPLTVNVKNTLPGSVNVLTLFDYKGGLINPDSLKRDTLHTYTRPGKYTIVQFSEKDGRKLIACPTVFVYDTLPPSVRLVPCGRNRAKLLFEGNPTTRYDSHWISWGDGNIQEVSTYTQVVSHEFNTPPPHSITIWGTVNPGLCRGRDIVLKFNPDSSMPVPSIKSLISDNVSNAELIVANPLGTELLLFRKLEAGTWESTGRTLMQENETLRITVDSLSAPCFRLQATDSCLAGSYVSEMICSINLRVGSSDLGNGLTWKTQELPPQAKVSIWKDAQFWTDVSLQGPGGNLLDPELSCGTNHCYQIHITSPGQRISSMLLCKPTPVLFCGQGEAIFIPDAFSPNGDGINDFLVIKGDGAASFELLVYSPWGSLLFHTKDNQSSWDGKFQGNWVPPGAYPYNLALRDPWSGRIYTKKGTVMLIK